LPGVGLRQPANAAVAGPCGRCRGSGEREFYAGGGGVVHPKKGDARVGVRWPGTADSCVMGAMDEREHSVYDAPSARIDDAIRDPGSLLRGFAGGWITLLLGIALVIAWRYLQVYGHAPPMTGYGKLIWLLLFAPVFWIGVNHHRGGQRKSASGVLLALVSFAGVIVGIIVLG
jgi:hypothetical protein